MTTVPTPQAAGPKKTRPKPRTRGEIEALVEERRRPWFGHDGLVVPSTFPRRDKGASDPLPEAEIHALLMRLGENAAVLAQPGDPEERPLVQLRRLNDFFGGEWLRAREAEAQTCTKKRFLVRKDGQARSPGARFFAVCEKASWKKVQRHVLTKIGMLWMFQPEALIMPEPRLRQARVKKPAMTPKKKPQPKPAKKGQASPKQQRPNEQRAQPPRQPQTPGFYRAVPQQQRSPHHRPNGRRPTPMPEVYTSVRRPR